MIVIDHDMDSLFELVERVTVLQEGRVLVEGTPEEIKSNADGAGSLSRRRAREIARMSLLEVNGLNSYYGDSHILFDVVAARREERGGGAARPQRRRQEHDAEEPDGRGHAAHAARSCSTASNIAGRKSHAIAQAGMQLVHEERRIFGSLDVEENLVLAGLTAPKRWPLERIYEMFPRLRERRAQPRHRPFGRRAADAGDRARAGARSEDHAAGRAVRGAGADHRARPARDLPRAGRRRPDHRAGRAEHRRGPERSPTASTSSTTATSSKG